MNNMEKWDNLTLADNYLFQKYMENEKNCKKLLSELFGRPVRKIKYKSLEKTIKEGVKAKGIRVDVYFQGDDKVYNVEMQTTDEYLPERSRYYHSMLDLTTLEVGQLYKDIKESYVIFICTFDPLKKNHYLYEMRRRCINVDGVDYDDKQRTIFLNTKGKYGNISKYMKTFLKAVEGIFDSSAFSDKIENEVNRIKSNSVWREDYMFQEMHDNEMEEKGRVKGEKAGKKIGKEEAKMEDIKLLLKELKPEKIIELGFDEKMVNKVMEEIDYNA